MKNVEIFADETPESRQTLEYGLRILARIVAEAIMAEISVHEKALCRVGGGSTKLSTKTAMPEQQGEKLALTIDEVAKLLGLSRASTYEAVHTGQIPSIRIGRRIIVPRVALTRIIEEAYKDRNGP